ncbi:hypothetical protein EDB80DRAFT_747090 [Ilyonectria destructans]|nr:hypothetical protein EDB80DRAFT_747090 [Ilyonectria destructans]
MEAVGLGVGVVGLAGVATSVQDAKGNFDSYKNAKFESQPLLAQRHADRILLQQWSERVGYGDNELQDEHHSALDDPKVREAVDKIVQCIQNIDINTDDAPLDGESSSAGIKSRQQGPRGNTRGPVRLEKYHESMPRKAKWTWAFQDKRKVSEQTQNVAALLQHLHDLVPPPQTHTANATQASSEVLGVEILPNLIQQFSMAIEKAIAQDMERTTGEFKRDLPRWLGTTSTMAMFDNFESPESDCTKVLWVHSPAGYGKTILCAKIIEYLRSTHSLVTYYFFSSDLESRADPFAIIRAWTYQIISKNEQAFELALERWEASDRRPISFKDIKQLFETLTHSLPDCVFIINSLDECAGMGHDWKNSYRQSLLDFFDFLHQSVSKSSRVAFVSRGEPEIREGLRMHESGTRWALFDCLIQPDDVKNDATLFARSIVDRKLRNKSEMQRNELSSRIVDRFESMFLGIRVLEGQLRGTKSVGSLHQTIDQAPTRLTDLYDRNWKRIASLQEPDRSRTLAILRWTTFALRPMTILELTEALLLADEGCDTFSEAELPDTIDEEYIRVEILELYSEPGSLTVHLTHFSVKQYILCHELIPMGQFISNENLRTRQDALQSNILAITCLRCLNFDQVWEEKPAEEKSPALQAFRDYAVALWHKHIKHDADNADQATDRWREKADSCFRDEMLQYEGDIRSGNRLFYAAFLVGLSVNKVDISGRTALLAASSTGGAGLNITSNEGTSPLYAASGNGHAEIVKLLLGEGSDLTMMNNGHLEVVKLLLEKGADLAVADKEGWAPLNSASASGADLAVIDENGWAPLNSASASEKEADPAVANNEGWTPLNAASKRGADLAVASNQGWTPFNIASNNGHLEIVKLLLERGADLAVANNEGWTPLNSAAKIGYLEVVKLLLERGADLAVASNKGWTPLNIASNNGHLEILPETISTPHDGLKRTPLFLASRRGHAHVVQALVSVDVDSTDTLDWYGSTPLFVAVRNGHSEVVDTLLATSKDWVDSKDGFGRSLMWWAKRQGHVQMVQILADRAAQAGLHIAADDVPLTNQSSRFSDQLPWCDACTLSICDGDEYQACETCVGGSFAICLECFHMGVRCLDDSHVLLSVVVGGSTE